MLLGVDPAWLDPALAAVMIVTAAYHLSRLVVARGRRGESDVDLAHAAMGAVMAAMFLGALSREAGLRCAVALAAAAAWFVCRGVYDYVMDGPRAAGHHTQQSIVCLAMVYLLAAPEFAGGSAAMVMAGMPAAGDAGHTAVHQAATGLLIAAVLIVGVLSCARFARSRGTDLHAHLLAPATTVGCQLAMIGASAYMLAAAL